jgi:hypothetical protein
MVNARQFAWLLFASLLMLATVVLYRESMWLLTASLLVLAAPFSPSRNDTEAAAWLLLISILLCASLLWYLLWQSMLHA